MPHMNDMTHDWESVRAFIECDRNYFTGFSSHLIEVEYGNISISEDEIRFPYVSKVQTYQENFCGYKE